MKTAKSLTWLAVIVVALPFYTSCSTVEHANSIPSVVERNALKQLERVIELELEQGHENLQENMVLVALYLDTEDSKDTTTIAKYRCYNYGSGGYSGINRIPFGTPWTKWEKIRSNRFKKKIVIDPGPPYKNFTKTVNLIPGETTNLGRIVLEKVKPKGIASILEVIGIKETVSIYGAIKNENGEPLKDVGVSSKKDIVSTNAKGFYRINGFGLEVCDLKTEKEGYIANNAKISIRNMDEHIIKQDFVLSFPRKVRFRYVISSGEKDDFNGPEATDGTMEFLVDKKRFPVVFDQMKNENFRKFADRVNLRFQINDGKLTLSNFHAPIFYKKYSSSSEEFEAISSVGKLDYNSQHCPPIHKGDIILINGGEVSNYTLKILFEDIQPIIP